MRMRTSDYLSHLRAKQKMRRYYNVLERQFRGYYRKAARSRGDTGTNLVLMLERRLDNVVYRMGFARTRSEARQLVSHKQVTLDGHAVNIPSIQVGVGQQVAVADPIARHEQSFDVVDPGRGGVRPNSGKSVTDQHVGQQSFFDHDVPPSGLELVEQSFQVGLDLTTVGSLFSRQGLEHMDQGTASRGELGRG